MNSNFQRLMTEAAAFTRSGDLQRATAALQSALGGHGHPIGEAAPSMSPLVPPLVSPLVSPLASPMAPPLLRPIVPAAVWSSSGAANLPGSDQRNNSRPASDNGPAAVGGRFIAGDFSCGAGRRAYKLYIPPQAGSKPLPLVVMLHGCTQNPDDFAAGTAMNEAASAQGFFVLYPAQSQEANPQRCWNWFKHNHQERGRGEPALLAGMTRQVMATHAVDARRVYVAGLSAGGAMAAILGNCHPDLFAAVGVHSGLAAGAAADLPSALSAMRNGAAPAAPRPGPPTIVFHGSADSTVHPANGEQAALAGVAAGAAADCTVMTMPAQPGRRAATRQLYQRKDGSVAAELWLVDGAPHAWAGGSAAGSFTDPRGPDASAEILRFFFERAQA